MTSSEKLDAVLEWFIIYNYSDDGKLKFPDADFIHILTGVVNKYPDFGNNEGGHALMRILQKLVRDTYLKSENIDEKNNDFSAFYSETQSGIEHYEAGGYVTANLQKQIIESEKKSQKEREKMIVRLTLVLSSGTSIAAIYYIFGLFDFYQNHSVNWQYCAYFLSGFGLGLLIWLIQLQLKKIVNKK